MSTYSSNLALIDHYINPVLGDMKISEITTRVIEKYYQKLLRMQAVKTKSFGCNIADQELRLVSATTIRDVHKILRNCFAQAVKWELMEKNPCANATLPKHEAKKREIWDAPTLFHAMEVCTDERLKLALNLAFSCSMRIGELLALTWDCVDISPEHIEDGSAFIYINKEIQRVSRKALNALENKDVLTVFPASSSRTSTVQVLKSPKTKSSVRKVFLPRTVAEMLVSWKEAQDETKAALGDEYQDYDLVLAGPMGMPTDSTKIRSDLKQLIEKMICRRWYFIPSGIQASPTS